ncbi:unnamed protein product [Euphydryas editha]|uniref:Uncharacterized protein n=1 Tax=Euphydryas editha TaxID=104508 RepID=A0AAU9TU07_EUPED|nr:unnamed protein product [Euphydryas editha]
MGLRSTKVYPVSADRIALKNCDNLAKNCRNQKEVENVETQLISPKKASASPVNLTSLTSGLLFETPKRRQFCKDIVIKPRRLTFDDAEE